MTKNFFRKSIPMGIRSLSIVFKEQFPSHIFVDLDLPFFQFKAPETVNLFEVIDQLKLDIQV